MQSDLLERILDSNDHTYFPGEKTTLCWEFPVTRCDLYKGIRDPFDSQQPTLVHYPRYYPLLLFIIIIVIIIIVIIISSIIIISSRSSRSSSSNSSSRSSNSSIISISEILLLL